jgi:hypothetical protein
VAQVLEYLPSKCEALSTPVLRKRGSSRKKKEKGEGKGEEEKKKRRRKKKEEEEKEKQELLPYHFYLPRGERGASGHTSSESLLTNDT